MPGLGLNMSLVCAIHASTQELHPVHRFLNERFFSKILCNISWVFYSDTVLVVLSECGVLLRAEEGENL